MCLSVTQYLSVADNARDAVLLHVSASSERQEWRNEATAMKKTTERHILTHSDVCGHSVLCFYKIEHVVFQVTQQITSHTLTVNITVTFLLDAEYQKKTTTIHVLTGALFFYSIKIYFIEIFFTKKPLFNCNSTPNARCISYTNPIHHIWDARYNSVNVWMYVFKEGTLVQDCRLHQL